mmetsp:Transcript_11676/g.22483  ORF Transcript_11676/g.22483 Transcript_11676/m.22483 type:complete len:127 (-) Transcript_11676:1111-1491(-)
MRCGGTGASPTLHQATQKDWKKMKEKRRSPRYGKSSCSDSSCPPPLVQIIHYHHHHHHHRLCYLHHLHHHLERLYFSPRPLLRQSACAPALPVVPQNGSGGTKATLATMIWYWRFRFVWMLAHWTV